MATLAEEHGYVLSAPIQQNNWDAATQTVVPGFAYPVHDNLTNQNLSVFVPASFHSVENIDQFVMAALAVPREALGVTTGS